MTRRTIAAVVLLVLAGVCVATAAGAWQARRALLDEDTWVETTTRLAADPAVQEAVADEVARQVVDAVDVEGTVSSLMPDMLDGLAGPAADRATEAIDQVALEVVRTDLFLEVFADAMRAIHPELVRVLEGEGEFTSVDGDALVLDLGGLLEGVQRSLADDGVPLVDAVDLSGVDLQITLLPASAVQDLQDVVGVLDGLVVVLPIVAGVLAVLGLVVASDRGIGLVALGAGVLVGSAVLFLVLRWQRQAAIDALAGGLFGTEAAAVVVDEVGSTIATGLVVASGAAVVVVVAGGALSAVSRRVRRSGS